MLLPAVDQKFDWVTRSMKDSNKYLFIIQFIRVFVLEKSKSAALANFTMCAVEIETLHSQLREIS